MADLSKATPRPWSAGTAPGVLIIQSGSRHVATMSCGGTTAEREANAALIVEAVNAYDGLREQLHDAQAELIQIYEEGGVSLHDDGCPQDDTCDCERALLWNKLLSGYTEDLNA